MRGLPLLFVAALIAAPPAAAQPRPAKLAEHGLADAVAAGRLDASEAAGYRLIVRRAALELKKLPPLRAQELSGVIADVAAERAAYTKPRALTLFSMLAENASYWGTHAAPADGTDVIAPDGVLYRYFPGHGLVFHPLGNFALLNNTVSAGNIDQAQVLAQALQARAIQVGRADTWEYHFPFAGGTAPWTSGMAQAVAAQALSRLGDRLGDDALLAAATAAYRAIPGHLLQQLPEGPWVKLYSFDSAVVLNAQLQTVLSLGDYARVSRDAGAADLATRLQAAAAALLPSFDTGAWSLYALHGSESPLNYHEFVVGLLKRLAVRFGDTPWRAFADRFTLDELQPPLVHPGKPLAPLYPDPQDGFKDDAVIPFYVSKLSRVTLQVAGQAVTGSYGRGWSTIIWSPGLRNPGLYHPQLTVVDLNGHRVELPLPAVELRIDATPPELTASVEQGRLVWHAVDPGTPSLSMSVRLARGAKHRVLDLGDVGLNGARRLKVPPGRWRAELVAANSAGHARVVPLGVLP